MSISKDFLWLNYKRLFISRNFNINSTLSSNSKNSWNDEYFIFDFDRSLKNP